MADSIFFPELSLDDTTYRSPLIPLLQELRRKHVVAASATGPQLDDWRGTEDQVSSFDIFSQDYCRHHHSSKRGHRRIFEKQHSQSNADICSVCGKRPIFDPIGQVMLNRGFTSSRRELDTQQQQRVSDATAVPEHAQALLQSTPHLRHLVLASTDMQGSGNFHASRGFLGLFPPSNESDSPVVVVDYKVSQARKKSNQQAAQELSSFLYVLAHEMSLDNYGAVENEVFTSIFALARSDAEGRLAAVEALDALIEAPSADEEKKAIKFANNLSSSLRNPVADYEFLSAVAHSLGHMAMRATNVDFVEAEIVRALEFVSSDRSARRLGASLILKELAIYAPTAFYSKTSQTMIGNTGGSNAFLDHVFVGLSDPHPIVRACAADALSQCLKILVDRQHASLTALLCQVHFSVMEGLQQQNPHHQKKSSAALAAMEQAHHGSLLAVACMIQYTRDFMLPRFDEICEAVLAFTESPKALIRLEVVRLVPRLARRCPSVFGRRYLDEGLLFLLKSASAQPQSRVGVDIRPTAFAALGQLILSMNDPETGRLIGGSPSPTVKILNSNSTDPTTASVIIVMSKTGVIYEKLAEVFDLVRSGLKRSRVSRDSTRSPALYCAADLVEALGEMAKPYLTDLIEEMFRSGLSEDLIECLNSISDSMPCRQAEIEDRLLQEMSRCLAGTPDADRICDPLSFYDNVTRERMPLSVFREQDFRRRNGRPVTTYIDGKDDGRKNSVSAADLAAESSHIEINMRDDHECVMDLVLCLRTLGSFGDTTGRNNGRAVINGNEILMLPFVRDVVSNYLLHPSDDVRRAAALTCCALLIPFEISDTPAMDPRVPVQHDAMHSARKSMLGTHSGKVAEEVLTKLLRVAVSDPSPVVRLCVVRALDERYDYFLCQAHHVQPLFFLLQDEALATRAAGLQLLGRLTRLNPAPILPVMRKVLADLIVELRCSGDSGRSREEATRLLVVFLRAEPLRRLVHPVMSAIVEALPLKDVPPRLASASLEALGELARASGSALKPWVKHIIPEIMETMQDQSSASKQRISLRTLGQIAGSTGYVMRPYQDYPHLMAQATDVLPSTKRAPWALRREVIRTLGIVGALDPDQYLMFAPKTRKGGAVGGGYFLESVDGTASGKEAHSQPDTSTSGTLKVNAVEDSQALVSDCVVDQSREAEDDLPAHLYMYEQYAMVALPVSKIVPSHRMTPADEDFYPSVAIQALTRIFKDQSLSMHHDTVMEAIMFIFTFLEQKCVPFLPKVVPHMLHTIRTCTVSNLRESLLKQVAVLSGIVREHLRPYVAQIFEIVDELWTSRHLGTILALVSKIASSVPADFRKQYLPRLVRKLLGSLEIVQTSDLFAAQRVGESPGVATVKYEKLDLILRSIRSLRVVLGEYLHLLVPALLKLADSLASASNMTETRNLSGAQFNTAAIRTLQTMSHLLEYDNVRSSRTTAISWGDLKSDSLPAGCSLPARAIQPLVRLLGQNTARSIDIGFALVETIGNCARQLGYSRWLPLYHENVRKAVVAWEESVGLQQEESVQLESPNDAGRRTGLGLYDAVIREMSCNVSQQESFFDARHVRSGSDAYAEGIHGEFESSINLEEHQTVHNPTERPRVTPTMKHRVNQTVLSLAWDVSQRASRDDWTEWMRRFAIELIRQAPSPAIRSTASLAHVYQPLARELFSAAFVCCWEELEQQYRQDLVHSLETAFVADVSPEILQTLLNLAEFMEHDGVGDGLPIDISNLAELALKCRSYAKALHYKEREYNNGGSSAGSCVEALISINKKLDLPEAALGVLKISQVQIDPDQTERLYPYQGYGGQSDNLTSQVLRNNFSGELKYSVVSSTDLVHRNQTIAADISEVSESWLAKLGLWSEALQIYERKLTLNPRDFEAVLGCMKCLDASGEWQRVLEIAEESWPTIYGAQDRSKNSGSGSSSYDSYITPKGQRKFFKFGAQAAWRLGEWNELEKYGTALVQGNFGESRKQSNATEGPVAIDYDGAFFTSVLHIHRQQWTQAANAIDAARKAMDGRFTALMAESYRRAYSGMISAQILAEMEEIIEFRKLESRANAGAHRHPTNRPDTAEARSRLLSVWRERLAGCRLDADVHSQLLGVRSLVLGPTDEVDATLLLSDLSRQSQMNKVAERVLLDPLIRLGSNLHGQVFGFGLPDDLGLGLAGLGSMGLSTNALVDRLVTGQGRDFIPAYGGIHMQYGQQILQEAGGSDRLQIQHKLYFSFVKQLWSSDQREEAIHRLESLTDVVDMVRHCNNVQNDSLAVSCWLELGDLRLEVAALSTSEELSSHDQIGALFALKRAIASPACGYSPWHGWALLNFRLAEQLYDSSEGSTLRQKSQSNSLGNHVVAAAEGFANAISLGTKKWTASVQQDMLNLLTCLFKYGDLSGVADKINSGMGIITLEAWLGVLPQLLARIHIRKPSVRQVLHPLLTRLGEKHPQALMYPLSVLLKSPVAERQSAAQSLMTSLRSHSSSLVEEALMVSSELIRVAILWLESWHEGLEDASRLYFGEGNVSGMLDLLLPLHEKLEGGAETQKENEFVKNFGSDLADAHAYVKDYVRLVTSDGVGIPTQGGSDPAAAQYDQSGNFVRQSEEAEAAMNKAWDIYYTVFRSINKKLPELTQLFLNQCSPALSKAHNLELGVPGSYRVDGSYVMIEKFIPNVQVITSKQRPRKITLRGSDGRDYVFLLKGHEDLRQDERVMQLFGLANALLARDRQTKKHDLNIQRYTISPLSHNCGVVGWVPHCETLHSMIRDYRQNKKVPLNMENREMLQIAPDYDNLTVMQKVEVFTDALKRVTGRGNDLYEILWLKSTNSEEWLERRTRFTRSLAVMSMVGYILGLGDRHPSNLMLDQLTGRVLHIDFGDCFEVAMNREKYPEKIPFRLTRMLVKAMEVSGIEGSYRTTCERTMSVLRGSKDSLVAMLEAFVHDPLISWRLAGLSGDKVKGPAMAPTEAMSALIMEPNIMEPDGDAQASSQVDNVADIDVSRSLFHHSIAEICDEEGEDGGTGAIDRMPTILRGGGSLSERINEGRAMEETTATEPFDEHIAESAAKSKSLQMYSDIQNLAADLSSSSRIASIAGGTAAAEGSMAKSRIVRSLRQRELTMSLWEAGGEGNADEALNEQALKVIRRVQDKLSGTDLDDSNEQCDVPDQVQRLIVQATSSENLCQLFIGWCAFW